MTIFSRSLDLGLLQIFQMMRKLYSIVDLYALRISTPVAKRQPELCLTANSVPKRGTMMPGEGGQRRHRRHDYWSLHALKPHYCRSFA